MWRHPFTQIRSASLVIAGILVSAHALSIWTASSRAAETDADEKGVRTVEVTLLSSSGKPVPGHLVSLYGRERNARNDWEFTTDAQGRFVARFEKSNPTGALPGAGDFYFIAEDDDSAGAVSPRILNGTEYTGRGSREGDDDWSRGRIVALEKDLTKLVMRIRQGITVTGRVVDPKGKPVALVPVGVQQDLGSMSHTGRGGEIFMQHAVTNGDGEFRFERVYPATFTFGASQPPRAWVRTRIRKRWWDERIDEAKPLPKERAINVEIVLAPKPPYRYHGRVTDEEGMPIAGAQVSAGVSAHRIQKDWGDDHHYESALTDADGRYELRLGSRFVRGFSVEKPGWQRADRWAEDSPGEKMYSPGEFSFALKPEVQKVR